MVIDSLEIARNKFPGFQFFGFLCKRFNIDISKRKKHNALLDCELLREVYINLLGVKEPKLNLSSYNDEQSFKNNNNYNKTVVSISETEIKQHNEFLKMNLRKLLLIISIIIKFFKVYLFIYFNVFKPTIFK